MVVGNNNVYPQIFSQRNLRNIGYATVNGNQKGGVILGKTFNRFVVKTVSFRMSMWNIICKIFVSYFFEKIVENNRAGNAIAIIIAVNNYFSLFEIAPKTLSTAFSIFRIRNGS